MSYEKKLEYLRKEFNKSSAKFHQAESEGYETDAEMWEDDMVNIGHQIHIHEQAAKTNEYEAKARAWDLLKLKLDGKNKSILSNPKASDEDLDFVGNNTAVLWEMSDLEMKFRKEQESGEPNAKK